MQRLWNTVINRLLAATIFMQLLMVLSQLSYLHLFTAHTNQLCNPNCSYWTGSRLEDLLVDLGTTSHSHHHRVQDLARQQVHEGIPLLRP